MLRTRRYFGCVRFTGEELLCWVSLRLRLLPVKADKVERSLAYYVVLLAPFYPPVPLHFNCLEGT